MTCCSPALFFFTLLPRPPISTLFPYTTLFRSEPGREQLMSRRQIRFGIIGCGLMGREFASAAARWCHLEGLDFEPVIIAACDVNEQATEWFSRQVSTLRYTTSDYQKLLNDPEVEAIYCAVPHNLHEQIYIDIIRAGKHLLGEKPFGVDLKANRAIMEVLDEQKDLLVRCSSEFPYFPGAYRIHQMVREESFGEIKIGRAHV